MSSETAILPQSSHAASVSDASQKRSSLARATEERFCEGVLTDAPSWLNSGRIPSLDGLRALAILLVIFAHSNFPGDSLLPFRILRGRAGFLGVQIFFVLSGFLITTLMLREVRRTGRLHLGHFYLRRALRIVPVYAAYLVLVVLLQLCGLVHLRTIWWLAACTWTVNLVPDSLPWPICHFWSLCVEEHFYLLWPLLMAVLPLRWCRRTIPAGLILVLGLRCFVLLAYPRAAVDLLTFTRIDDVAVGCGLAFLAHDAGWRRRLHFATCWRCLALLVSFFLVSQVLCSNLIGARVFPHGVLQPMIALGNDVNTLTIAVLMWFVLTRPAGFWGRLLNRPLIVWLGVLSYSAYLWHLPLCEKGPAWLGAFPQNIVFIFTAAFLSYTLIEKPFLSLKDRMGSEKPPSSCLPVRIGAKVGS